MFAAVYIAKESIEQVVLGASGNEHGGHGHGHGHGGADLDGEDRYVAILLSPRFMHLADKSGRPFPTFLLFCAMLAACTTHT